MVAKKQIGKIIDDPITGLKIIEKNKPFLEKGHIFEVETNSKWLINFDKIPELINIELSFYWTKYENWFNWNFNNPCICPFMFIGEKDYPYRCGEI